MTGRRTKRVFAALTVAGVVTLVGCGRGSSSHAGTASPTTTTAADVTLRAEWRAALHTLSTDQSRMQVAAADSDTAALGAACATFGTDLTTAQAIGDIRSLPVMMSHLRTALDDYAAAAADCVNAVSGTFDAPLLSRGANEATQGTAELNLAAASL